MTPGYQNLWRRDAEKERESQTKDLGKDKYRLYYLHNFAWIQLSAKYTHTHTRTHNPRVSSEKLVNSMERFINFLILKNEELALAGIAQWFE